MTLGKLADSGFLKGNALIAQCVEQQHRCDGGKACVGCSCIHNHPLVNITRNSCRTITRDVIKAAGGEKYLDKEVVSVFGHRREKLAIEIRL